MGYNIATVINAEEYLSILSTPAPVFLLFVSQHCAACAGSAPLFERIAGKYPAVTSRVLDCAQTPRHPEVTGTPTLLIYLNGNLVEKLKGFGPEDQQPQRVEALFKRYALLQDAAAPVSPAAPPPQPPSGASPHAPGHRPPPAGGRAGS
ncbi:thioredoxin family protein [Pseudomonas sp. NIBRBAC000502773]|nr:thioredoxin family protein [Pseudomonas sp. NIBRBAC000502773]